MLFIGNLYQVRQFYQYLPDLGRPELTGQLTTFVDRVGATVEGGLKVIEGQADLPGDKGRWYFGPSRPILHNGPQTPIEEFPLFTFLYADMHPHLLDMPAVLVGLAWILSLLLAGGFSRRWDEALALLFVGGLVIGYTQPTHTWDFPSLLGLAGAAIFLTNWRRERRWSRSLILRMVVEFVALAALCMLLYRPFSQWFGTEYTSFIFWDGARTPLVDYLTVHGLFLFILVTYLWVDSREWLKERWLKLWRHFSGRSRGWLALGVVVLLAAGYLLWNNDYQTLVLALPLLAWSLALLFRPNQPVYKLVIIGLTAAGIGVTALVEVLVLKGDVDRNNMVFRYYLQAWIFFSIAAAAALIDLLAHLRAWKSGGLRAAWLAGLVILGLGVLSYPITAIPLRVADRWPGITNPPHALDGMDYMLGSIDGSEKAIYDDNGHPLDLSLDYAGIRYLQDNAIGSPVIVEGLESEYRWGNRYSIYTGLPAVMGWHWHVSQHNSMLDGAVFDARTNDVNDFYNTTDLETALRFLDRYDVGYVIVGQLERGIYSPDGLAKFSHLVEMGKLKDVIHVGGEDGLVIYQTVHPSP